MASFVEELFNKKTNDRLPIINDLLKRQREGDKEADRKVREIQTEIDRRKKLGISPDKGYKGQDLRSNFEKIGDFAADSNEAFFGGLIREGADIFEFLTPGDQSKGVDRFKEIQTDKDAQRRIEGGSLGGKFGKVQKGVVDIGSLIVPAGAASKVVRGANAINRLGQGGRFARAASVAVPELIGGGVATSQDLVKRAAVNDEDLDGGDIGKSFLTGAAIDAASLGIGPIARRLFGKGKSGAGGVVDEITEAVDPTRRADEGVDVASGSTREVPREDDLFSGIDSSVDELAPPKTPSNPDGLTPAQQKLRSKIKSSQDIKDETRRPFKDKFSEQFFDKLSPLNKFVNKVETRSGKKLLTEENPYQLARLSAGVSAQTRQRLDGIVDILGEAEDLDAIREIGIARRVKSRPDIDSLVSQAEADEILAGSRAQLGEEGFARANQVVDEVVKYNEDLLRDLQESGVISKDAFDAIVEANGDYFSKFNVVRKMIEAEGKEGIFRAGNSMNLSKQNVVKALKGMREDDEILDPIEALALSTDTALRTINKNKVFKSMYNLSELDPEMVPRIRDAEDVTQRISLSGKNKELRPIRNSLNSLIKTKGRQVRRLQSQLDRLNKEGLAEALKKEGTGELPEAFRYLNVSEVKNPKRTSVPAMDTITAPKNITGTATERLAIEGGANTRKMVEALISEDPVQLRKIRRMIANREPKLAEVMDDILDIKADYDVVAGTIRQNIDEAKSLADAPVPEGYERVSGFIDGVRAEVAIPQEVANAYKGLTQAQSDYLTKTVGAVNNAFKQSVTSLSLPFALIRNPIRDFKTMAANSQNIPPKMRKIVSAWVGGLASAFKQDEAYQRWIKAGGGGAGIYADVDPSDKIARDLGRKVNGVKINNAKDLLREGTRLITAPIRLPMQGVQRAGGVLEAAPRLAEFKAGIDSGMSDEAAAFASRNVTVDFSQSGTVGQLLNSYVPFLNARLQGNKKLLESAARDPKRFAKIYGSMTAIPVVGTIMWNKSQFKDVWDQISDFEKDNNFLIIAGDGQDENGDYNQIIKIPKADLDKIFGNPLENFFDFLQDDDPDSFQETALQMLSSISPIDFVDGGSVSGTKALGALPPIIKTPAQIAGNKNFFFDSPIVPDSLSGLPEEYQVKEDTSAIAKTLGNALGVSPLKVEQAVRDLTGSLFTANPVEQLGGAVQGASGNQIKSEFYDILKDTGPRRQEASLKINEALAAGNYEEAYNIVNDYNATLVESFKPWAQKFKGKIPDDLKSIYAEQKMTLTSRGVRQRVRNLNSQ